MVKVSAIGLDTDEGKQILLDFINWKTSGFKPWGPAIGGRNHYESSSRFKMKVSPGAFRAQAQKIARIALQRMPAHALPGIPEDVLEGIRAVDQGNDNNEFQNKETEEANTSRSGTADKRKHQQIASGQQNRQSINGEDVQDESDGDDADYVRTNEESCSTGSDDDLEDFENIQPGELQNSRAPFLSEYSSGEKLLAIFPLDGNVFDSDSHRFVFIKENTAIERWGKVPKERESCVALIGLGSEKPTKLGFSEVDLMVIDDEIKLRRQKSKCKPDKNGDIWEVRATLELPFQCEPQLYAKNGKKMTSFRMLSGPRGFSWGYFWLLAWNPPEQEKPKRIGAQFVNETLHDESSAYTEKTYKSKK